MREGSNSCILERTLPISSHFIHLIIHLTVGNVNFPSIAPYFKSFRSENVTVFVKNMYFQLKGQTISSQSHIIYCILTCNEEPFSPKNLDPKNREVSYTYIVVVVVVVTYSTAWLVLLV